MVTDWEYFGDVDIEQGGYYYRHDLNSNGFPYYTDVIRVTDLDGATGADGLTLIEQLSTFGFDNKSRVASALSCCGWDVSFLRGKGKETILAILVDAFLSYGYYDPAGDMYHPDYWIVVNDSYGALSDKRGWDGWTPNRDETVKLHHEYNGDLEAYITGELL